MKYGITTVLKYGITAYFGSNLLNYVNCSDQILKKSFEETTEEGLIRVEVTSLTLGKGIETLKQVKDYLNQKLTVCYTPGYMQLKALIEGVRETFLILDVREQTYYYCYYADLKADKAIGYMSNKSAVLDKDSSSHYLIMSLYNLPNIPCTLIKFEEDEGTLTLDAKG